MKPAQLTGQAIIRVVMTVAMVVLSFCLQGQSITGPTSAYLGERQIFYFVHEGPDTISWAVSLGSVYSTSKPGETLYEAAISFDDTTGVSLVYLVMNDDTVATHAVTVTLFTPPTPNAAITIAYGCGTTTVNRSGNLDRQSYSWWWQTSATGTDATNPANRLPSITLSAAGNLWLRARLNSPPYTWSAQAQAIGAISINNTLPAAPTQANPASLIGPGPITVSVGAVAGASGYAWYTQASGGTPIENQSTNSYSIGSLGSTTTYYVASKNTYCESSTRLPVTASILPPPTITVTSANANVILAGQPVVLATTASYATYTWKSADGTVVGTSPTLSVTNAGAYRVAVTASSAPNTYESEAYSVINMISGTVLNGLSFQYRYDHRNRMTHKRVPGADWVYMVYDDRDRLVLTQDGNQRATATWTFTKYDELNRPILTGIRDTTAALTQEQMQAAVNTHYLKPTSRWGESYVGSAAGNVHGYSNRSYPVRTGSTAGEVNSNKYLTVTYYDDYSFRSLYTGTWTYVNENLSESGGGVTYNQPSTEFTRVTGQVTGTKVKVLDGGSSNYFTWLKAVNYYDDRHRLIQTITDNYKGGTDRVTNVVDFTGKVLETKSTHVEQDIVWKDLVGTAVVGNKLDRTLTGSSWAAGAVSTTQLAAAQNGWIELTLPDVVGQKMIALVDTNPDGGYTSLDYALYLNGSTLQIYENGALKTTVSGALVAGNVLRIERNGTTITYKRNGTTVYTSATPSSTLLMADASIYTTGASIPPVIASFASSTRMVTRRFEYDHAGRLLKVRHQLSTPQTSDPEVILLANEYNELGQLVDKKLHSADNGTTWKQSVDSRYNIRGWLQTINNSKLEVNAATNDDTNDYFGMELKYNTVDTDISNTALFNGNISGVKWSSYPGTGTTKEKGYTYSYDPMNRILGSVYKEKTTSWTAPTNSAYAETGFTYDLNGNIKTLNRNDGRTTGWMDNLAYDYTNSGNQLQKVTDNGDDYKGFVDGTNVGNDYTYDANGNMLTDQNKGITGNITYNFLNLPELVTRGVNNVRYIYDATGRKLAQVVTFVGATRQTDYAGEFIYENDALQFINHEEGRIVTATTSLVYTNPGESITDFAAVNATLAPVTQNGTEKYIRVTSNGTTARTGVFPVGGSSGFPVTAGERYRIRVKGYRAGTNPAYISIKLNDVDQGWPGTALPSGVSGEAWTEQTVSVTATGNLKVGVTWNTTVALNEILYVNEVEITKLSTNATPEYQYHLKDHLGNVRTTFTSVTAVDQNTATLESANLNAEQSQFVRIATAKRVSAAIFDRTNGAATGFSERLNGSMNEKYGVAKSISVMPGDVIQAEVYGKYVDQNTSNWTGALTTLMNQIAANTAGVVYDGASYGSSTSSFPFAGLLSTTGSTGGPKAYLNWLIFDRNYNLITGGYQRMSANPKEQGQDVAHELLSSPTINITQAGYVYIYLSNEETTPVEVYFDDFKVTHTKSPVVQTDDYYPFGLTFNSFRRENSTPNQWKFQGQEHVDDLGLGWDSFKWRNHQPEIGRFFGVDPLAEEFFYNSPYAFSENQVTNHIELEGLEKVEADKARLVEEAKKYVQANPGGTYGFDKEKPVPTQQEVANGAKMDCAGLVRGASTSAGFQDPTNGNTWEEGKNGVAMVIEGKKEKLGSDVQDGDYVTFKTNREEHQGPDGKFDHIGIAANVVSKDGVAISFDVIHSFGKGSKSGPKIDPYVVAEPKDHLTLKGVYESRPQTKSGPKIAERSPSDDNLM